MAKGVLLDLDTSVGTAEKHPKRNITRLKIHCLSLIVVLELLLERPLQFCEELIIACNRYLKKESTF